MDSCIERIDKLVDSVIYELENRKCEDMCMSEILEMSSTLRVLKNIALDKEAPYDYPFST